MARKGWDQLSPGYRARLEKNGVTEAAYNRGESIQAARGHSQTPERPTQAAGFQKYLSERTRLVRTVTTRKQHFFGTSPKWNPKRAAAIFAQKPPSMAQLRYWATLSKEDWLDAIREDPTAASYLGYH